MAKKVSDMLNIGVILGTLLFPFVGMIMGLIYVTRSGAEEKKAGKTWLIVGAVAFVFWLLITASSGY